MNNVTLVEDWKKIAKKSWSMQLMYAGMALSAVSGVLSAFNPDHFGPWLLWAIFAVNLVGAVCRLLSQPELHSGDQ